jgi:hypothetical protein
MLWSDPTYLFLFCLQDARTLPVSSNNTFITFDLRIPQHPKQLIKMPLFNRKPQAADVNTATAVGGSDPPATEKTTGLKGLLSKRNQTPAQERAAYGYDNLNARPRFGQWLKGTVCVE